MSEPRKDDAGVYEEYTLRRTDEGVAENERLQQNKGFCNHLIITGEKEGAQKSILSGGSVTVPMSKLEDLEKKLYDKNDQELRKRMRGKFVLPEAHAPAGEIWREQFSPKGKNKNPLLKRRVFKISFGFFAAFSVAAVAVFLFFYLGGRGQEAEIRIEGRDSIESGETVSISFIVKNTSRSALKDAEIAIVFPFGTKIVENGLERSAPARLVKKLSDLKPGEEAVVEVSARIFGQEGTEKPVEAIFLYRPESLEASFSAKATKTFKIEHVPLALTWEAQDLATSGQDVELKVHFVSDADKTFDDLSLKIEYPSEFTSSAADPKPDVGDFIWKIGALDRGKEGAIIIRGKLNGEAGDVKTFKASIGMLDSRTKELDVYSEASKEIKISASPLSIKGFAQGRRDVLVSPGEPLNFTLRYKNNSQAVLKNITLNAFLESGSAGANSFLPDTGRVLLDYNTLSIDHGGVYDSQTKSIIWAPGNFDKLRELGPGEEGEVGFAATARASFSMKNSKDKNMILRVRSIIDAADVPQELAGSKIAFEDSLDLKSKTKALFAAKALFRSFLISTYGQLPPKVGARTSYAIHWEIRNFSNDLQGAEIKAALPPNVKWEEVMSPPSAQITFNKSSGEVKWSIGRIIAGTGVLNPALIGAFQVSIAPSDIDAGRAINLMNKSVFSATDEFTGERITLEADALTTELKQDSTTSSGDWKVAR